MISSTITGFQMINSTIFYVLIELFNLLNLTSVSFVLQISVPTLFQTASGLLSDSPLSSLLRMC